MSWIKNILSTVNTNSLDAKKQKQFGYLLMAFLILYLSISIYKSGLIFNIKQNIAFTFFVGITVATFLFSKCLYPLLFIWFFIGEVLGKLSSFVILALVYYAIFTLIALILNLRKKAKYKAKWIDRNDTINYENLG